LYLIDTDGNHRLVHEDAELSCWHATPLVPRETPPEVRTVVDPRKAKENVALCVVNNIYQGMEGVAEGEVKWIRVNEALPRYWSTHRRWGSGLEQFRLEGRPLAARAMGRRARRGRRVRLFRSARRPQRLLPGPGQGFP
jgi:hypothetical protein